MENGWVKIHRSIDQWEWRSDPNTFSVWLYLLTHARHEAGSWRGVDLQPGQLITSRDMISKATGVSVRGVRTALERLEKAGNLTIKSTNKFSLVTVEKWAFWQRGEQSSDQQNDQQTTSKRPANDQQTTTNKNVKNKKKGRGVEVVVSDGGDECSNTWEKTLEYYGFPTNKSDLDKATNLAYVYSEEWLTEALRRTGNQGEEARNWRYVETILKKWTGLGYIDAEGKHAAMMERIFQRRQA